MRKPNSYIRFWSGALLFFGFLLELGMGCQPDQPPASTTRPQPSGSAISELPVKTTSVPDHILDPAVSEWKLLWSPDGLTVSYITDKSGRNELWIRATDGTRARQISQNGASGGVAWSPEGGSIAFLSDHNGEEECSIRIVDIKSDVPSIRRVNTGNRKIHCQDISWHPDGNSIAFTADSLHSVIYSVDLTNSTVSMLLSGSAHYRQPAWSPRGDQLAFTSNRSGAWDIWTYAPASGKFAHLTHQIGYEADPAWSPDGALISYFANTGGTQTIWIVSADGGTPVRATDPGKYSMDAAWSPDGTQFSYTTMPPETVMWSYEFATGKAERLIEGVHWLADWSPDGTEIAYLKKSEVFGNDIWRLHLGSSKSVRLTEGGQVSHNMVAIRWSPDGRFISYTAGVDIDKDLWVISANGGEPRPLTMDKFQDIWHCWSPDSRQIAYTSIRDGRVGLWVLPATGGLARPLLDWTENHVGCDWSADGRHITFNSENAVWITDIAGKNPEKLTTRGGGSWAAASWSSDDNALAYVDGKAVMKLDLETGFATELFGSPRLVAPKYSPTGDKLLITQIGATQLHVTSELPVLPHQLP